MQDSVKYVQNKWFLKSGVIYPFCVIWKKIYCYFQLKIKIYLKFIQRNIKIFARLQIKIQFTKRNFNQKTIKKGNLKKN